MSDRLISMDTTKDAGTQFPALVQDELVASLIASLNDDDGDIRQEVTDAVTDVLGADTFGLELLTSSSVISAREMLDLPFFDARDYGVSPGGDNNVANLLDVIAAAGAAGGGIIQLPFGTIDTVGTDRGTVTADSGNSYTNNGGLPIPEDTPIVIQGHGVGATVLKLSPGMPRAFDFWHGDTNGHSYSNIVIRQMTVDGNNLVGTDMAAPQAVTSTVTLTQNTWVTLPGIDPDDFVNTRQVYLPTQKKWLAVNISGSNLQVYNPGTGYNLEEGQYVQGALWGHVLIGNISRGWWNPRAMTIDSLLVEDVAVINVATPTPVYGESPSEWGFGVGFITGYSTGTSSLTNMVFRRVRIEGGQYGFNVLGSDQSTTPIWHDNILFEDCWHDTMVDRPAGGGTISALNYYVGGNAWTGNVKLVRCTGRRSWDVAYELQHPWRAVVEDCIWDEAFEGCYRTSTLPPANSAAGPPTTTLGGSMASGATTTTVAALPVGVDRSGLVLIDSELMWYTATNEAGTAWNIAKAANGTSTASHSSGATVTFVQADKTRIMDVRSTIYAKEVVSTSTNGAGGRGWSAYENSHLPLPPLTIRDGNVTIVGGLLSNGQLLQQTGWCPEVDMEGVRYTQTGWTTDESSGYHSLIVVNASNETVLPGCDAPAPRFVGRNNIVKIDGDMATGPSIFVVHHDSGWVAWDLAVEAHIGVYNAAVAGYACYEGVIGRGSHIDLTLKLPAGIPIAGLTGATVGATPTIQDTFLWDINLADAAADYGTNDVNLRPWAWDSSQTAKMRYGRIQYPRTAAGKWPSTRPRTVLVSGTYAVTGDEQVILCNTTSAGVTLTLPKSHTGAGNGDPLSRGRQIMIVDAALNAGTNNITVTPYSGDRIDSLAANASVTLDVNGGSMLLTSVAATNYPTGEGWVSDRSLTDKTLSLGTNTVTGTTAQFNTALSDGDFATLAGTETLTGKTISLTSNTLTGTVAEFNTALSDGDFATVTKSVNAQTGTTYELVLTDAGKLVTLSNAAAITLTVPANSTVAFPVGTVIDLAQLGAGQVTFAAAGGVTVSATPGLKVAAQYGGATLTKLTTDTWLLVGALAA